ncbi:MAG: pyridoxamine 5'-phosphate oxidase [Pseudomonadota bacterium]
MNNANPVAQIEAWIELARQSETEPEAMALATADAQGRPSVRMVLMRGIDEDGIVFYTNLISAKAKNVLENPYASACFHWKSTARQVRVEGPVVAVDELEADGYFASRHRESQIGAWASKQSSRLDSREKLERRVEKYQTAFAIGPVPRPEFWSGFRIGFDAIEFWENRPHRLHERWRWTRKEGAWQDEMLYP